MTNFRIEGVIDAHTCDQCRLWHGKIVDESGLVSIAHHCENENGCRCYGVETDTGGNDGQ